MRRKRHATQLYQKLVDKHRKEIMDAEEYIWRHPETGFREWKTDAYMQAVFEGAGYTLIKAGNIPGFYTDIETGRPGPKLLILAELDALSAPNHFPGGGRLRPRLRPPCPVRRHGRHRAGTEEPGALDGLSGSIRLMCVPAEELIELEFPRRPAPRGRDPLSRRQDGVHAPRLYGWRGSFIYVPHRLAHRLRF